jgi:hypothetical protein
MRRAYSRLAAVEEKRNVRKAVLLIILSIAFLVILFFYGLPLLVKFAAFVGSIGKSNSAIEATDTTPPGPPFLGTLPSATKDKSLTISGTTESGATVTLSVNDQAEEVVASGDGNFSFQVNLNKGDNTIFAFATDAAGNKSTKTKTYQVVFDNEAPQIEVTGPTDGQTFSGQTSEITVSGTTKAGSGVTVNDRIAKVEADGSFSIIINLSSGTNTLNIKAIDTAGNTAEKAISVTYNP